MVCNTRIWVARGFLELFLQQSRSTPWAARLATPTNLGLTSKRSLLFAGKLKSGFTRPYQNSCWDGRNYNRGGTEGRSETQLIMARLRVHVVFAIIQRLLALGRSSMKPKLYVGLRVARRGFGPGPLMISYQLAVFNASYATKPVE